MKAFLLAAALVAAGAAASPVLAQSYAQQDDVPSAHVSYRDVDFANAAQVRAFYAQLRLAAQRVCRSDEDGLGFYENSRACERDALNRAVGQVNRQELYALHGAPQTEVAEAGRRGH
jgi:UrcA family protein